MYKRFGFVFETGYGPVFSKENHDIYVWINHVSSIYIEFDKFKAFENGLCVAYLNAEYLIH